MSGPYRVEYINCRICGSDNWKFCGVRGGMERSGAPSVDNTGPRRITNVVRCRRCGFVYVNPMIILEGGERRQIYADPEKYLPAASGNCERLYASTFKIIEGRVKKGRLLDVGSGKGEFLDLAKKRGWEAFGLETSEGFADYSRENFGVEVTSRPLDEAGFPREYFDAVTLNMVLEHADKPLSLLNEIKKILKDDGILFIEVPNMGSLMLKLARLYFLMQGKNWSPLLSPLHMPFHNYGYSKKTFVYIADAQGWKIEDIVSCSGHLRGFRNREGITRGELLLRDLFTGIGAAVQMGDAIKITLRKFTPHPEGHACEGMDEWPSGGIPLHGKRNPETKEATAVRPWSFTVR